MNKQKAVTIFEWSGSILAMAYALLIASNAGNEILGFSLLLLSSMLFGAWGYIDKRWAFFALQFFYAASAIIGLVRWRHRAFQSHLMDKRRFFNVSE